ncbi:putative striated muscle-specific serine/threonine-protein kinase-like [Apostichopus japonicus]|uniref:Putative striated muscle-specific serine/threonine-protein kinase-like n=1 Tax=Stichopus japonicus TaxID=307972 RepID=A0A2G8JXE4_STIJA|nr:putative striated muscle-specific serine/threonine-protein kinase-like [Apostichopus japonicus]
MTFPVVETENIKFTNDGNKYEMEIMRVSEGDTGAYLCKATNSIGMRDCKAKLSTGETGQQNETPKIKVPPSFIQVADNRILKEGEPVSFEFKFKGQPQPTVVWKFNGKSILRADRHAISQPETGTARLAIHSPRASDCGEYTCVVYNSEGETSSIVHLSKGELPKKKNSEMGRDAKNTAEEQGETMGKKSPGIGKDQKKSPGKQGPPCKAPPVPKLDPKSRTLSWEVESKHTDTKLRYIIEARKKGSEAKEWKLLAKDLKEPKYSINHLDPKTEYVFRVRAESDSGISEPSEEIDMSSAKSEDAKKEDSISDGEEKAEEELEDKEPGFLETTEEVYALDNEDATLECFFTGHPTPKITWMQDDDVLSSDDHFIISVDPEAGKATLLVKGVTYDDIGEYECIAVNDKGYADCRLYLDVAEPPKFVQLFENLEIPFGYSLRLDCRLDGIPEPDVVWSKDDMPLKQSGRVKFLFEGEDGASLLLENFSRTDCGEYSIRAYNIAGDITHSVMVTAPGVNIEPIRRFRVKKDTTIQDDYEILEELGRGAYGIVHRAKGKISGLERAAKFITIKAGMWEEVRNEIKIMGMLSHKRLIGLYDAYETDRQVNMAMEIRLHRVTGGELFERIVSQDSITEGEAVFFLKQVIDGVSHMHERNVVHLDLKPENILLESADSDNIKVIDFGLARVLKPDEEIQCACGTPEFVAPEVVRRKPITPASDVWSIGVIAYILLSGCSPFMGEDDRQTLVNVRDGDWEFEEDIWDNISEEAKDFIAKVLVVEVE